MSDRVGDGPAAEASSAVEALWAAIQDLRRRHDADRAEKGLVPLQKKELAERVGVPTSTLGDWLNKQVVVPGWYEVEQLIRALNGDPRDLSERWKTASKAYHDKASGNTSTKFSKRQSAATSTDPASQKASVPNFSRETDSVWAVPTPLTRLVGRGQELEEVIEHLRMPETRLVTLLGAGGTGKTRLALAVASKLRADFANGIVFVDLAPLRQSADVMPEVGRLLGLRNYPNRSATDAVIHHLETRQMLLVLDNFEHVADATPGIIQLLQGANGLRILLTSRQALRVTAEQVISVDPLPIPDEVLTYHAGGNQTSDVLLRNESVRLFAERAAAAGRFQVNRDNVALVAAICRRLEGIPLAIELVAAQTRGIPLPLLLSRLGPALDLPQPGPLDLPVRQRSLRATMDWSWGLLTEVERRLLRVLARLPGGWTTDTAEYLWADQMPAASGLLSRLVDKSLVQLRADSRFSMLYIVRDFISVTAQSGADRQIDELRLIDWAERLALKLGEQVVREGLTRNVLAQFEAEQFNIDAALEIAQSHDAREAGLKIIIGTGMCYLTARPSSGHQWISWAARRSEGTAMHADLSRLQGAVAQMMGQPREAEKHQRLALQLADSLGDDLGAALARRGLGLALRFQGRFREAKDELETAFDSLSQQTEGGRAASLGAELGEVLDELNQSRERALELTKRYATVALNAGDLDGQAYAQAQLGLLAVSAADRDAAVIALQTARTLLSRGLSIGVQIDVLGMIGIADLALERDDEAEQELKQQLSLMLEHGYKLQMADALTGLGVIAGRRGEQRSCARLLAAAEGIGESTGLTVVNRQLRLAHEATLNRLASAGIVPTEPGPWNKEAMSSPESFLNSLPGLRMKNSAASATEPSDRVG